MEKQKKEFSIFKWVLFPLTSLLLAAVIAWFNLTVFGAQDGISYFAIVGLITLLSVVINKYTSSPYRGLAIAAFVCEIFLTAALMANALWSLSVQRNMSVAKQSEASRATELERIQRLDRRAQRIATEQMGTRRGAQDTFEQYKDILFWIMAGELALYGICAFSLLALAQIVERSDAKAKTEEQKEPAREIQAKREVDQIDTNREKPQPAAQVINGKDQEQPKRKFDSH